MKKIIYMGCPPVFEQSTVYTYEGTILVVPLLKLTLAKFLQTVSMQLP